MIESSFTLYKLIILYMLQNVNFPLSNTQISDFILEKEYTNYFHLQEALSELQDTKLIEIGKLIISGLSVFLRVIEFRSERCSKFIPFSDFGIITDIKLFGKILLQSVCPVVSYIISVCCPKLNINRSINLLCDIIAE